MVNAERLRLDEADTRGVPWRRWGPYLSERQWGTVREQQLNLCEVAREISDRLTRTFLKETDGRRPVHGGQPVLQSGPHWRDLVLFYEYFHGDNGVGIGASHQTGWTGTAALLPLLFRGVSADALRSGGRGAIKSAAAGRRAGAAR
ncbi:MAG: hypothetical protein ABR926_24400 [Streptosporangiaceae bacterium]|jgi:hypothetical protein